MYLQTLPQVLPQFCLLTFLYHPYIFHFMAVAKIVFSGALFRPWSSLYWPKKPLPATTWARGTQESRLLCQLHGPLRTRVRVSLQHLHAVLCPFIHTVQQHCCVVPIHFGTAVPIDLFTHFSTAMLCPFISALLCPFINSHISALCPLIHSLISALLCCVCFRILPSAKI